MEALFASRDITLVVLTNWLEPRALWHLDDAMCKRSCRLELLKLMQDPDFCVIEKCIDSSILQWMWMRGIGMKELLLPPLYQNWDNSKLLAYLEKRGSLVTVLEMSRYDTWCRHQTRNAQGEIYFRSEIPLSSSVLACISRLCPNLTSILNLCIDTADFYAMGQLRINCPGLTQIGYCGNWQVASKDGFWAHGFQKLLHLKIPAFEEYLEECLIKVAKGNRHLQTLMVDCKIFQTAHSYNSNKGDTVYAVIAGNCSTMERLDLGLANITDAALISLSNGCRNLKSLTLYSCTNITSPALIALSTGCPLLEELIVRNCRSITDEGVIAVARQCRHLQIVDFSDCIGLKDDCLQALFEYSHELKLVVVSREFRGFPALQALDDRGVICVVRF